jgi:hypothetical protein
MPLQLRALLGDATVQPGAPLPASGGSAGYAAGFAVSVPPPVGGAGFVQTPESLSAAIRGSFDSGAAGVILANATTALHVFPPLPGSPDGSHSFSMQSVTLPPTAATPLPASNDSSTSSAFMYAIVGGAIGCVCGVTLLILAIVYAARRRSLRVPSSRHEAPEAPTRRTATDSEAPVETGSVMMLETGVVETRTNAAVKHS